MKTKIYAAIFILLLAFVAFTLYNKTIQEKNANRDKTFKVADFNKVSKIEILDKAARQMILKKEGEEWILNDKYPVNMHLFKDVKDALENMEAMNPIAKVTKENVIFEMMRNAIKVSVFEGNDEPSKVIYVGGPNISNTASKMFLEFDGVPSQKIYEVSIPGKRGFLTTRFLVNEPAWRSKKIFSYEPDEFKEIEIKYVAETKKTDFVLAKSKESYVLNYGNNTISTEQLNDVNIVNYILELRKKMVIDYSFQKPNDDAMKDSLLINYKFAEVKITNQENEKQLITVVDMPVNEGSNVQFDINGDRVRIDGDYKYIIFGKNKDWAIISNANFGKLFIDPVKFIKN